MTKSIPYNEVLRHAAARGLRLLSSWDISALEIDYQQLVESWELGRLGELHYLNPSRSSFKNPATLFEGVQSALVFAVYYQRIPTAERPSGKARVARYAWGKDYHHFFRGALTGLVGDVERSLGSKIHFRAGADAWPILERAIAASAGLGFIGKNTMLIRPGEGSYSLLGAIFWDCRIEAPEIPELSRGSCGTCTRCLSACPTNAFSSAYQLDARKCISYLTIEKRGTLTEIEGRMLDEWIFGCDICQEVCPFNHGPLRRALPADAREFMAENGSGAFLDLREIFRIPDEISYRMRFSGSPLLRAKRQGLLRNGLWVAFNTGERSLISEIQRLTTDTDPVISQTAQTVLSCGFA